MAFSSASLVRAFSTSGLKRAVVKTPIPVFGIEGRCETVPMGPACNCILYPCSRYAAALYSAANKNGALEAVEKVRGMLCLI